MFHPKQNGLTALISRALGKRIGLILVTLVRHPFKAGALLFGSLLIADSIKREQLYAALSASDFTELALAAMIFSALLIAVIYAFILFARQVLAPFHRDE